MKVLVIEPHKKPYTQEVEHTLGNLQRIVGGLIEPIYLDDVAIVVNEEGKINGLPFNRAMRDENKRILDLLCVRSGQIVHFDSLRGEDRKPLYNEKRRWTNCPLTLIPRIFFLLLVFVIRL